LVQVGVLDEEQGKLLREMAGYRNRMVHFYHQISDREQEGLSKQQLERR